jgi:hypothetical protein
MKWTKNPPTETGFYFFRDTDIPVGTICVVKYPGLAENHNLRAHFTDGSRLYVKDRPGAEWAGPIPEPKG